MDKMIIGVFFMGNILFADVGIIKKLSGKVEIKRQGKILNAKRGQSLKNGDIINTKEKSYVSITFDDGSRLSLEEKSIFIIHKFIVKPSTRKYKIDLELKKGKAMFSSGKIGKLSPESFKLRLPNGKIGIRGTSFIVEVK